MAFFKYRNIRISAVASAVPNKTVKSEDFSERFGSENVRNFISMTGVKEHRESGIFQTASDFACVAAEKLLSEKNIDGSSIGLLVFGTLSTDYRRPSTACVLHKRLGLSKECAVFDVGLGCSAFIYCANIACSMMANSDIDRALVLVGETMTKMVNPEDRSSAMLFGDGGAAVLFEKTDKDSEICGTLCSDGNGYKAILVPAGGFRNMDASREPMVWADGNTRTLYNVNMNGTDVFAFTISDVPRTIKKFLESSGKTVDDYDCFAMHQANQFIQRQLSKKLKVPMEKMPLCLDRYGNTSAPAIPLVLCDAFGGTNDSREMNVLMCGFGVGLSWGVLSAKMNTADIFPVIKTDDYFAEGIINSPEDMQ